MVSSNQFLILLIYYFSHLTHPSLYLKCHHQITFYKLILRFEFLPPYQCFVWNFKTLNNDCIKKAIASVNQNFLFSNKKVHEQVIIFNQVLMNIYSNYISKELITVNGKDSSWMNESIKKKIKVKMYECISFNASNKNYDAHLKLKTISRESSEKKLKEKRINTACSHINQMIFTPVPDHTILYSTSILSPILINNKLISQN